MTNHNPFAGDHDYERVRPGCECPRCGEDDIDSLVWIDDERVRCDNCDHVYQPGRREDE
ncbi:MAG TPA: hypothetical protein VH575_33725 [Gemmataceae bacterium]